MRCRRLGSTRLEVSALCAGTWALGGHDWGGQDEGLAIRAIQASLDAGMSAIDTAAVYGLGGVERLVGRAIRGRPSRPLLMTKAGLRWKGDGGPPPATGGGPSGNTSRNKLGIYRDSRPESLRVEVEHSLQRLGVEVIDLLQIHWPDPRTPVAETMGALLELRGEGKIREIGVSNFPVEMLDEAREALGDVPLAAIQAPCSPINPPSDVIGWARRHAVGVLAYGALGQGLLTGSASPERLYGPDDHRSRSPRFSSSSRARVDRILRTVVKPIADGYGASIAQTILAWTLEQPGVTSVLVGVRSAEQVGENTGAGEVELLPRETEKIRQAFARWERRNAARRWLRSKRESLRRSRTGDADSSS